MVERFPGPCECGGCVVCSLVLMVGSSRHVSLRLGATLRIVPEEPKKNRGRSTVTLPGGSVGPSFGARLVRRAREGLVDRFAMKPSWTQPEKATCPLLRSAGSPPTRTTIGVGCAARKVAVKADGVGSDVASLRGRSQSLCRR